MDAFQFHAELFEVRSRVLEELGDAGYEWLSHFGSIDLLHDVYGVEVCGIHDDDDAEQILALLGRLFPAWHHRYVYYKDCGAEIGWKAVIHRDCDRGC